MFFGVAAMLAVNTLGGLGGTKGRSLWWGLLILPYPIGWILAIGNLIARLIERACHRAEH